MTKKKKIIIAVAILAIILLAFIGGQAYAKYVTELKGQGTAQIATWSFKVNGGTEQVQTIDLTSTFDNDKISDYKIAPGTSGSFNIVVDGTGSDVGIMYNISFSNESTKPQNLKFEYENVEYNSIEELQSNLSGVINAKDEDKTKTLNIKWKWDYETGSTQAEKTSNDIIDTQNAKDIQDYTFDVSVTGTQVNPQA